MALKIINIKYDKEIYNWLEDKIISGTFEIDNQGEVYQINSISIVYGFDISEYNRFETSYSNKIELSEYNNTEISYLKKYNFSFDIYIPNKEVSIEGLKIKNFCQIKIDIKNNIIDASKTFYPNIVSKFDINKNISSYDINKNIYTKDLFLNNLYIENGQLKIITILDYLITINNNDKNIFIKIYLFIKNIITNIGALKFLIIFIFIELFIILNSIYLDKINIYFNDKSLEIIFKNLALTGILFNVIIALIGFFIIKKLILITKDLINIKFNEKDYILQNMYNLNLTKENIFKSININYNGIYNCKFEVYLNYVFSFRKTYCDNLCFLDLNVLKIKLFEYSGNELNLSNLKESIEKYDILKTLPKAMVFDKDTKSYYQLEYKLESKELGNKSDILNIL